MHTKYKMNYYEIRQRQNLKVLNTPIADYYVYFFSPFFSSFFMRFNISPNMITILMMIFGVLGAFFLVLPYGICKIGGIIFIHLWYIMDASDGEVARITRNFSKYGKEMDYTAHVVNHPLFIFSFLINMINADKIYLLLLFATLGIDTIARNLYAFSEIKSLREEETMELSHQDDRFLRKIVIYILLSFDHFPMFAMLFPMLWIVDLQLNSCIALLYLSIRVVISGLLAVKGMVTWIKYIYKAK